MNPESLSQGKQDPRPSEAHGDDLVQTGALPGGQPGHGVNHASSPTGQSNVDATTETPVEYGEGDEKAR